ncbi:hypothetical protein [Haladaptatus salinisoli]|uniref:hypothetical protein n=1 Tax=Haladaptatus salinisoli TaxID=2884876 RepID=UPI001D0A131B|nr:hypothetical protein [Haladaptatus salinisoli]
MVFVTRGLRDALLELAANAEPERVTVSLAVTPAGDLRGGDDLPPPETPVFTHFYPPDTGGSVTAVFGMDLSIPAGQSQGRFVSHPQGDLEVARTDDLHEAMLVAVPPWRSDSIAAFDRAGRKQRLVVLDAEPPAELL